MKSLFWFILGFFIASAGFGIADIKCHKTKDGELYWLDNNPKINNSSSVDLDINPMYGKDIVVGKSCTCPSSTVSQEQFDLLKKYVDAINEKTKVHDKYIQSALDAIVELSKLLKELSESK